VASVLILASDASADCTMAKAGKPGLGI